MDNPKNLVLFASGSGSNVENIHAFFAQDPRVRVAGVFCNNPGAGVVERCARLGVPLYCFNRAAWQEGQGLMALLHALSPDLVVLAGYLWKIPAPMVEAYPDRIINIHPALLPKFGGKGMYGMHVHRAVLAAGEPRSGITIHYVNEAYDKGDILLQKDVAVSPEETPESLARKIHALEYEYFPKTIASLLFP